MAFFESIPPVGSDLVYALFGFQDHHRDVSLLLKSLAPGLKKAASHFEMLACGQGIRTIILLGIFESAALYQHWWHSLAVRHWWHRLPPTAGVWREVYTIPASRFQSGFNQPTPVGIGNVFTPQLSKRAGYWGAYRARIPDCTHDDFQPSPVFAQSPREINRVKSTQVSPGRTRIKRSPHNLCFIREGQDYEVATGDERSSAQHWQMRQAADSWLTFLEEQWDQLGGLSFLRCSRIPDTALASLDKVHSLSDIPTTNDCVQIALFQSLWHMERLARGLQDHLHLHSSLNRLYCPMGKFKDGQCGFWVEMGILPRGAMEAEYVGCLKGTGLMDYHGHEGFYQRLLSPGLPTSLGRMFGVVMVLFLTLIWLWS
ncbi:hem-containing dehydratase protein [Aspergillus multicolor]|uniref:hem-containing dehydratase protein n=1 Tax=Aspergillus multicolor TaxID=41759 RepID=UPI003CCD6474